MSLLDRFRKAERRGINAAREQMERARLSFEEAQSMMRRKMRIHPRTRRTREAVPGDIQDRQQVTRVEAEEKSVTSAAPESTLNGQSASEQPAVKRPIVSVNGKDVAPEDLDRPKSDLDRLKDAKKNAA